MSGAVSLDGSMKIAQVCARYSPDRGGVETHVQEISEGLAARGIRVEVLTTDPTGSLPHVQVINDVLVRRFFSIAPGAAYFFSPGLYEYLRRHSGDYDLVHAHGYHSFPALYAGLSKRRNKLIFTPHYHGVGHTSVRRLLHVPYKRLGKTVFETADSVICVSRYERSQITRAFKVDDTKISVVPNGVNLRELTQLKRTPRIPSRILYVGRLERYKRVDRLIEAIKYLGDGIVLDVVGTGADRPRLEQLATRLGVKGRVNFAGTLSRRELLNYFSDAGAFVSLSKHEAFGITVAEALTVGIPSVVADESALSEFIDNTNCFGVGNADDPELVAGTILRAMKRTIPGIKPFNWATVTDRILEVYGSVLGYTQAPHEFGSKNSSVSLPPQQVLRRAPAMIYAVDEDRSLSESRACNRNARLARWFLKTLTMSRIRAAGSLSWVLRSVSWTESANRVESLRCDMSTSWRRESEEEVI